MTLGDSDIRLRTMNETSLEKSTTQEKEQKTKGNGFFGDLIKLLNQVIPDTCPLFQLFMLANNFLL